MTYRHAFCFCDLDLDPMTLILDFDLDILNLHLLSKHKVSGSRLSKVRARTGQTGRLTDRHADSTELSHFQVIVDQGGSKLDYKLSLEY